MTNIQVKCGTRTFLGSCNFCDGTKPEMFELAGEGGLTVRICSDCLLRVKSFSTGYDYIAIYEGKYEFPLCLLTGVPTYVDTRTAVMDYANWNGDVDANGIHFARFRGVSQVVNYGCVKKDMG